MLVFVDESGDTGLKIGKGSSERFTVALVLFEEHEEAQAADNRISLLRTELGLPAYFEFHFKHNTDHVRQIFLATTAKYNYFYFGFVLDKSSLLGAVFQSKSEFYKYVCGLIFENAKPYLDNAIVKIDGNGDRQFRQELAAYLKKKINDPRSERRLIKKVQMPDSKGNNLIQLADMICGAIARSYRTDRKDAGYYRRLIKHREIDVSYYPND